MVKPRAAVHRDGDWHGAFHVWISWRDAGGVSCVLLQRRSLGKDTMAGRVDVSVGGHYRAGEMPGSRFGSDTPGRVAVTRELHEELGLVVAPDALRPVGRRWMERAGPGWIDREVQDIFALLLTGPPERIVADAGEVAAVLVVGLADLHALVCGRVSSVPALERRVLPGGVLASPRTVALTVAQLVPASDGYWERLAAVLARLLAGLPVSEVILRRAGSDERNVWG